MKNTATLATLAAGLSQVAATGFGGWGNAPAFNCPANQDNKCTEKQIPGFDWKDLPTGKFENYGGFNWKGFTCENKFSKRDELAPRTFGFQDKCISGVAHHDKGKAPNFSCNGKDIEKTSIGGFQVTPEFDCDLEFHYGMPDGSTCKHRTPCKKSGTYVQNSQCGGAKNVTVIVPKQPAVPKETCNFGFHSASTKPPALTTSSTAAVKTSSSASVVVSTTASTAKVSSPVVTSSSVIATTSSIAVVTSKTNSVPESSKTGSTVAVPSNSVSKSVPVGSVSKSVPVESASTHVTTYMTTSTMYTTSVQTITSCGSTVSNCPAASTATTVVTVAVSTTICPVTETHVSTKPPVESAPGKPVESAPGKPATTAPGKPVESAPGKPTGASSTDAVPATSSKPSVPAGPVETLPCPAVVPSCLNTWMFSVGCKDNTDAACYCPDSKFTNAIYECMAAHGDSQETIADAIQYFKGICAPFISTNPGIATGADSLTYITAKPTPVPSASYTTIMVTATTVVPVTNEAGAEVTSSSSTVTISTTMTVPQIAITTGQEGAAQPTVGVVPGYPVEAQPAPTGAVPAGPTGGNPAGGAAPYPTTMVSAKPTGTGAIVPTASASQTAVITAGAARVGSGVAFGAFVAIVAAAL
ncbi:adhesin protein Mad1 [Apiospora kogelbergensis]|uniref:Adhesin protein Mad1 n=1 Tax=Apiospora kogelbergensis TaxID=1337665 RepID=A0AAW0QRD8_9PEZI